MSLLFVNNLKKKLQLFIKPIDSSELDIHIVQNLSNNLYEYNIKDI